MQLSQLLEFVYFLSFVIDQHLEEQCLSFLAHEIVHWFVDLDSILDCIFGCFDKARFWLIAGLLLIFLSQLIQLSDSYALFFYTLFPHFQFIVSFLLLSLALFLFLLHAKNLTQREATSASSGMAKGDSYFGTDVCLADGILGSVLLRRSSSIKLYILYDQCAIMCQMYCLEVR